MLLIIFAILNVANDGAQTEIARWMALALRLIMIVIEQRNTIPIETFQDAPYHDADIIIAAQHSCQRWKIRLLMYF